MKSLVSRFASALALIAISCCVCGVASAQQAWDTNVVSWTAPTTCTSGQPIANCAVTGYRVEESTTVTGTYRVLATVTATTYSHTGVAAGQHCYRSVALSAKGESAASNVACKTNVAPSGPPNPPSNLTVVEPLAYDVRPNEQTFAFIRGRAVGTAKLGAACDETRTTGGGFFALERPSRVALNRQPRSVALVAKCGAAQS